MALKLMYITNRPEIAKIAEKAGVDRIFVDLEYIGKELRQKGRDTVKNRHQINDVERLKKSLNKAEVLARVNPIHKETAEYSSSKEEIDGVIAAGADYVMLPYFKTASEVKEFIQYVDGRAKTVLLVETPEAGEIIDELLELNDNDEFFVGLNDLSLGYGKKFMFELLEDGTVEKLTEKFRKKGVFFGFGGIAALGKGMLPAEYIIREHYRLESKAVILSRSFCNTEIETDLGKIREIFETGLKDIRLLEEKCNNHEFDLLENKKQLDEKIKLIRDGIR